jgi:hypothetical protein
LRDRRDAPGRRLRLHVISEDGRRAGAQERVHYGGVRPGVHRQVGHLGEQVLLDGRVQVAAGARVEGGRVQGAVAETPVGVVRLVGFWGQAQRGVAGRLAGVELVDGGRALGHLVTNLRVRDQLVYGGTCKNNVLTIESRQPRLG